MRDLKHLIYFENLLQQANNDLVQDACKDGRLALAWNCSYIPEVLLDTDNCFGVRLRAPNCTNPDMATYYMTNRSCPYSKSILERAFEGGYNFLDALIGQECCCTMNRMEQYFDYCELIPKDKFFVACIDMPINRSEWHVGYYRRQMEKKILEPLRETYGVDFSEERLRAAIAEHNELCRIITEMGDMRKAENPVITGYEFHVMQLVSLTCPKYLVLPLLRETLEELKTREPEPKNPFRARVVVVGSEIDDVDFVKLVEETGAYVCADRFCYGSLPGRVPIELNDAEDALTQVCRHYMTHSQCPRYMDMPKMLGRREYVNALAKEYNADGIIYEQIKFCDPWAYERMVGSHVLQHDFGYPVLSVDRPYTIAGSGQMRTRVQAFVESIEIKKIQGGASNG